MYFLRAAHLLHNTLFPRRSLRNLPKNASLVALASAGNVFLVAAHLLRNTLFLSLSLHYPPKNASLVAHVSAGNVFFKSCAFTARLSFSSAVPAMPKGRASMSLSAV
jgi:hypothetical protein